MNVDQHIEAILFFKSEPVAIKKLASILELDEKTIQTGLETLKEKLNGRGVQLVIHDDKAMLATHPSSHNTIETLTKEELTKDLGKAGLETLSIILYKGPISRREIDHIRGVNSNFILRNLLIRGLIEKATSLAGERSFTYKPTIELLSFLGITHIEELPEYGTIQQEIEQFVNDQKEENS